jgi:hypothetical protein
MPLQKTSFDLPDVSQFSYKPATYLWIKKSCNGEKKQKALYIVETAKYRGQRRCCDVDRWGRNLQTSG